MASIFLLTSLPATAQNNEEEIFPIGCEDAVQKAKEETTVEVVNACNGVLFQADLYIKSMDETIQKLTDITKNQESMLDSANSRIADLEDRSAKWHKNPFIVGGLSFLAGGLAISILDKR